MKSQDSLKLLAVDNDTGTLDDIRACLEEGEITISTATSGAAAMRILEFSKVDLVILDIQIPDIDSLSFSNKFILKRVPGGGPQKLDNVLS